MMTITIAPDPRRSLLKPRLRSIVPTTNHAARLPVVLAGVFTRPPRRIVLTSIIRLAESSHIDHPHAPAAAKSDHHPPWLDPPPNPLSGMQLGLSN